jgi:hypothetical protein
MLLELACLACFSAAAQAQVPHFELNLSLGTRPVYSLELLARRGTYYQQPYAVRSSCQPSLRSFSAEGGGARLAHTAQVSSELLAARTFYQKRLVREQYEQQRSRRMTSEDVATLREHRDSLREVIAPNTELAQDRARRAGPRRTSLSDLNPLTGQIHWPEVLGDERYFSQRTQLESLFATRARYGAAGADDEGQVRRITGQMKQQLASVIGEMDSTSYVDAKTFLSRLAYEARFTPARSDLALDSSSR